MKYATGWPRRSGERIATRRASVLKRGAQAEEGGGGDGAGLEQLAASR